MYYFVDPLKFSSDQLLKSTKFLFKFRVDLIISRGLNNFSSITAFANKETLLRNHCFAECFPVCTAHTQH